MVGFRLGGLGLIHKYEVIILLRRLATLAILFAIATPLAAAQWSPVGPEGGTIRALVHDPQRPQVLYAGGSTVFRSGDGGTTWSYRGRGLPYAYALAISGGVLYAGAQGVWRSADEGVTWQPAAPLPTPSWAADVSVLVADPRQPGRLWAAGTWSLWLTVDGGDHWTERTRGIPPLGYLSVDALALDPTDGQLWVSTRFGVFTAMGDGKRWTSASEGLKGGRAAVLAVDPTAAKVVLAANLGGVFRREGNGRWTRQLGPAVELTFVGGRAFTATTADVGLTSRIFYSDDHGKTWVPAQQQPDRSVLALTGSSAGVFAGTRTSDGRGGVYRSLDGGVTWTQARAGLTNLGTDVVVAGPPSSGALYAAGDTQLSRSLDGGAHWEPLVRPNAGPNPDLILALLVEPGDSDTLYVATPFYTGGVFRSEDGGASWVPTETIRSHVIALRADPRHARALWAAGWETLHHTSNGGVSWDAVALPKETYLNVYDFAVDPASPAMLWLAGSESRHGLPRLYRSADGGQTWARRDSGIGGTSVVSIDFDPAAPNTLYAATDAGLYRSIDTGATWTRFGGVIGPVHRVLAAPTVPTTIWTVVGLKREVRRSRDAGATWEWARRGLDGALVFTLEVDPLDPQLLYAGTGARSVMVWSE